MLRVSDATNKEYGTGEMINMLYSGTDTLDDLMSFIPNTLQLPFDVIYTFGVCYYYFSWTLYASGLVMLALIGADYAMDKVREIYYKNRWDDESDVYTK